MPALLIAVYRSALIGAVVLHATRLLSDTRHATHAVEGLITLLDRIETPRDLDDVLVWLDGPGLAAAPPVRTTILTERKTFVPHVTLVPSGSTLVFPNADGFDHNVFSRAEPLAFDLGLYGRGESRDVTVSRPGVLRLYCNVHAKMSAIVLVHATRFATRADRTGHFALGDVPAGNYTLHVWHERGGAQQVALRVPLTQAVRVTLDARAYRALPHLDKVGKPYDARGRRY
ncbi:MAG: hypothetical protein MUF00_08290 [Gemmatimonadaceae bacterium]|nr:hypothetical protein [Gemmatimonadaceae bacterium]